MSTAGDRSAPIRVRFYPAEEALRRARPLPPPEELKVEGLTDEEADAFLTVIADL